MMRRRKLPARVLWITLLAFLLAACGKQAAEAPVQPTTQTTPPLTQRADDLEDGELPAIPIPQQPVTEPTGETEPAEGTIPTEGTNPTQPSPSEPSGETEPTEPKPTQSAPTQPSEPPESIPPETTRPSNPPETTPPETSETTEPPTLDEDELPPIPVF